MCLPSGSNTATAATISLFIFDQNLLQLDAVFKTLFSNVPAITIRRMFAILAEKTDKKTGHLGLLMTTKMNPDMCLSPEKPVYGHVDGAHIM